MKDSDWANSEVHLSQRMSTRVCVTDNGFGSNLKLTLKLLGFLIELLHVHMTTNALVLSCRELPFRR